MKIENVDTCVIGSGAAGAVIAYHAARKGRSTLIVERGPYVRTEEMSNDEIKMIPRLYKDGGMQMNTGVDFFILQGSCVGGSTAVSNMVLMRAKDRSLAEWSDHGADVDRDALHKAYDEIETLVGARIAAPASASRSTHLFEQGARKIGLTPKRMLKAVGACLACGNCNIGCTFGAKQSALTTFIPWAEESGARVLSDTVIERIVFRRRRVAHLEARSASGERIRIVARNVVLAAGAIGSSAVLLASGIERNVGRRLSFNVGAMIVAELDEALDAYDADQMTAYVETGRSLIEATHNPLMSGALTTPGWMKEHGDLMRRWRHLAYAGAMVGSEPVGRVVLSRWMGHEETRFDATAKDMSSLREGLETIARIFFAAGAKRVLLPTEQFTQLDSTADIGIIDQRIRTMRDIQCGSSHPQGGNAMSDDPERGVVDSRFAVHGTEGLFLCDASVFPTSLGLNPMFTVLGLAQLAAQKILATA